MKDHTSHTEAINEASGHTPGPWQFNPSRGDITAPSVQRANSRIGGGSNRDDIWNYYGGEVVAETVALCDGPLLAAATELLEALIMVRDADDDCARDGLAQIPAAARGVIDSAIAKATGKVTP